MLYMIHIYLIYHNIYLIYHLIQGVWKLSFCSKILIRIFDSQRNFLKKMTRKVPKY